MLMSFGNRFSSYRKSLRTAARRIVGAKTSTDENHNSDCQNQNYPGTYPLFVPPPTNLRKRSWTLLDRIEIEAANLADKERTKLPSSGPHHLGRGKLKVQHLEITQLTVTDKVVAMQGRRLQAKCRSFYVCIVTYGAVLQLSKVVEGNKNGRIEFGSMGKLTTLCRDFKVSLKIYRLSIDKQTTRAEEVTGSFELCGELSITPEHLQKGCLECYCGNSSNLMCVTAKVLKVSS